MINPPFPWKRQFLDELKKGFENSSEKIVQVNWYWEPFHRPGFEALKFAHNHKMSRQEFEEKIATLSCPYPPEWLSSKVKKEMQKQNILGSEGELKPLDPQKFIQKTFEEARFEITSFDDAHLFSISDLKLFMEENSLPFQPEIKGLGEVTELSKWLTPYPDLLKTFHCLKVWDSLEFLEPMAGLFKSSSILNFTRIY